MMRKIQHIVLPVGAVLLVLFVSQSVIEKANAGFFQDLLNKIVPDFGNDKDIDKESDNRSKEEVETVPYAPTIDYEEAVINAVEEGLKSVVSIIISKDVPVYERCLYDPFEGFGGRFDDFFGRSFPQFYRQCDNGKTEKQEIGGGSGFLITEDGLILTNRHVVLDEKADYTVFTSDGEKYAAKVVARDPVQDIAVVKIDGTGFRAAKLGDSSTLRIGQTAIAIGNALAEFQNSVSVGVVSGLHRTITASGGPRLETLEDLIQTDTAINQGNSGGPLLNLKGEVIGINVAVANNAENIGFAIPINYAKRDIESVKKTGSIKAPYIGVRYTMVTPELAEKQKLTSDYGALVRGSEDGPGIVPGSPAEKAGLLAEDIITEVDGVKLEGKKTLVNVLQKYNVGDKVTLRVKRGDKTLDIGLTLEERPKE